MKIIWSTIGTVFYYSHLSFIPYVVSFIIYLIYLIYPIKIKLYCIILSPEILTILEFSNYIWRKLNRKHSIFRVIFPDVPCFDKIYIAINSIDDKYFT